MSYQNRIVKITPKSERDYQTVLNILRSITLYPKNIPDQFVEDEQKTTNDKQILQNEIDIIQGKIVDKNNEIVDKNTEITGLNQTDNAEQIATLEAEIATLEAEIVTLEAEKIPFQNEIDNYVPTQMINPDIENFDFRQLLILIGAVGSSLLVYTRSETNTEDFPDKYINFNIYTTDGSPKLEMYNYSSIYSNRKQPSDYHVFLKWDYQLVNNK